MCSKTTFVAVIVCILLDVSYGQRDRKFFRKDYTFLEATNTFYKIHTIQRSWAEAKKICKLEGASFYYAESDEEAKVVLDHWHQTQPLPRVWIGVSDLVAKGVFETYDGIPISEVYHNWAPGEPNDNGGFEDCVIMRRDGTLNDVKCEKHSFICKKKLQFLEWNTKCNMPNPDYKFIKDVGKCYKFHNTAMTWTEAYAACSAEQAYLAIINNQVEADYLELLANIPGNEETEAVHLGFHNRDGEGWQTVRGTTLEESGYVRWGANQPDGGDRQQCGSMFYNGRLNDISCDAKCNFICESVE
ncbi:unnamed protein product [Chrysodeixis includens]|uniref:C-type lectin domain-containing protein n=1 Tax=Chrysodeixis includens TaxID=689277 RepID=A0A9P0BZG4_CHRIL|nr:unnamed protein product [Chrysodeixis includens]